MALSYYFGSEPFFTLTDFDRLFDEAFNARTSLTRRDGASGQAMSHMRPRYVPLSLSMPR